MNIEFIKANNFPGNPRPMMSEVFVEGWYNDLKMISKDKEKLQRAFEHIFDLDGFYLAVVDQKIMAFVGVCSRINKKRIAYFDKKACRKGLGFIRGSFAALVLNKVLVEKDYPFEIPVGTGIIEFVATLPEARGQGLAGKLIEYTMADNEYQDYILEVIDTNHGAINLYERLGFVEFTRVKSPYPPQKAGFEEFIYMGTDSSKMKGAG